MKALWRVTVPRIIWVKTPQCDHILLIWVQTNTDHKGSAPLIVSGAAPGALPGEVTSESRMFLDTLIHVKSYREICDKPVVGCCWRLFDCVSDIVCVCVCVWTLNASLQIYISNIRTKTLGLVFETSVPETEWVGKREDLSTAVWCCDVALFSDQTWMNVKRVTVLRFPIRNHVFQQISVRPVLILQYKTSHQALQALSSCYLPCKLSHHRSIWGMSLVYCTTSYGHIESQMWSFRAPIKAEALQAPPAAFLW